MNLNEQLNKISATIQAGAPCMSKVVCAYLFVLWVFSIVDTVKQIEITQSLPEFNMVLIFSAAQYVILISIAFIYSAFTLIAYQNTIKPYYSTIVIISSIIYVWVSLLLISLTPAIANMIGESYLMALEIAGITYTNNLKLYEPALIAQIVLLIIYMASLIPTKQKSQ